MIKIWWVFYKWPSKKMLGGIAQYDDKGIRNFYEYETEKCFLRIYKNYYVNYANNVDRTHFI